MKAKSYKKVLTNMSRGSTFTLYRAYNNFKIDETRQSQLRASYYDFNKKHDWGCSLNDGLTESEKSKIIAEREKRWTEDIPLVMNMNFTADYNFEHDSKNCKTLEQYRNRKYANFVLRDDGRFCDMLLDWDFNSSFDCLIEHYNLNYCNFRDRAVIITKEDAKEMLSAIEYLLGGRWDDAIETTMNNPWIRVFSSGGNCDSYWKYVYRHRDAAKKTTYKFSDSGVEVTVNIPKCNSKKTEDGDEEYDESYLAELSESNETVEYNMRNAANALRAFLESDNWSYGNETELVLVYSSWG